MGQVIFFCAGCHILKKHQKTKAVFKPLLTYRKSYNPMLLHTVLCYSPVLCAFLHGLVTGLLCIVNINSMEKVKYLCADCKIWSGLAVYIVTLNEKIPLCIIVMRSYV